MTNNEFIENYTGRTLLVKNWVNVRIHSCKFTNNTYYDNSECDSEWPTIQKFIDSNRIQPNTGYQGSADSSTWNGYAAPSEVLCNEIILTKNIYDLKVEGGNII